MSKEKVFTLLKNLGLTRTDTKVYIFIAKKGPKTGKDLCNSLKMKKQQLSQSLKSLQKKGVVKASSDRPFFYSALDFKEVLDFLIKTNIEEAQQTEQDMEELISICQFMIKKPVTK